MDLATVGADAVDHVLDKGTLHATFGDEVDKAAGYAVFFINSYRETASEENLGTR